MASTGGVNKPLTDTQRGEELLVITHSPAAATYRPAV
jgi:TusA-related sulfurtransferase